MASVESFPGSRLHLNLLNLRDSEDLETAEAVFTAKRDLRYQRELIMVPPLVLKD